LTAIIEREGDGDVALCPELDIASQGESVEQARDNLHEALELFFETASQEEIGRVSSGYGWVKKVGASTPSVGVSVVTLPVNAPTSTNRPGRLKA